MSANILTQEKLKTLLHYNPDTGIFTWISTINGGVRIGKEAGWITRKGYKSIQVDSKTYLAHRLAFLYMTGALPVDQVDHLNRDKLDNRFSNLRECDESTNSMNTKIRCDNTSGINGVSFYKPLGRYVTSITVNQKRTHLGYFSEIWDAICARQSANNKYGFHPCHGDSPAN